MDREMLIEAAKRSCEHNWMTNYLIPLCSECGFTEDGFRYFNRGVEKGFDFAISLLQWKDVADGLPEVDGSYLIQTQCGRYTDWMVADYYNGDIGKAFYEHGGDTPIEDVLAWMPIPEYVKEQR